MNEKNLAKLVREFLKRSGIYFIETKEELKNKRVYQSGHPDFIICVNGLFAGIELKSPEYKNPESKLRSNQIDVGEWIKRNGGFYFVSNNFEEIIDFINFLRKRT